MQADVLILYDSSRITAQYYFIKIINSIFFKKFPFLTYLLFKLFIFIKITINFFEVHAFMNFPGRYQL